MSLNPSGLSEAILALRTLLSSKIFDLAENRILIGSPKQAEGQLTSSDQQVALFAYHLEPSPFRADMHPDESPTVRIHCLITPFGVKRDNISVGENELRLMGEVVRVIHENPTMTLKKSDDSVYATVQLMAEAVNMEQMNKVWSAQGDTVYRLSVGCELSLVPVTIDPTGRPVGGDIAAVHIRAYAKDVNETDPAAVVSNGTAETIILKRNP